MPLATRNRPDKPRNLTQPLLEGREVNYPVGQGFVLRLVWPGTARRPGSALVVGNGTSFYIPVNKNGDIPQDVALARLMHMEEGDRRGRGRNVLVDVAVLANTVAKAKSVDDENRLRQYRWYLRPNESDFEKMDTPDAKWPPPEKLRKGPMAVAILGTKDEREAILTILNRNFTDKERSQLKGLTIEVRRSVGRGIAGFYQRGQGASQGWDRIVIEKNWLFHSPDQAGPDERNPINADVVTHEVIHFLRNRDKWRQGLIARPHPGALIGSDSDLEESFTEAETHARLPRPPREGEAGYYGYIRKHPKVVEESHSGSYDPKFLSMTHDKAKLMGVDVERIPPSDLARETDIERGKPMPPATPGTFKTQEQRDKVVRRMFKGLRGKRAPKKVLKEYENLAISRLSLKGRAEAIDTYWRYKGRLPTGEPVTVATHIYSPDAKVTRATLKETADPGIGRKQELREWQDGKLVKVS